MLGVSAVAGRRKEAHSPLFVWQTERLAEVINMCVGVTTERGTAAKHGLVRWGRPCTARERGPACGVSNERAHETPGAGWPWASPGRGTPEGVGRKSGLFVRWAPCAWRSASDSVELGTCGGWGLHRPTRHDGCPGQGREHMAACRGIRCATHRACVKGRLRPPAHATDKRAHRPAAATVLTRWLYGPRARTHGGLQGSAMDG